MNIRRNTKIKAQKSSVTILGDDGWWWLEMQQLEFSLMSACFWSVITWRS